jgi:Ca2+/Na+ antiporter
MHNIFPDGTENSAAELVEEYWVIALVWSLTLDVVLYLLLKGHLYYWLHYVAVLVILTHYLSIIMLRKHSSDKVEDQLIQIFREHCYLLCF